MDAFAVAVANGAAIKTVKRSQALMFGVYFGSFQAAMALLGWFAGRTFASSLEAWGGMDCICSFDGCRGQYDFRKLKQKGRQHM